MRMRHRFGLNTIAGALLLGLGMSATAGVVSYQGRVELGGSPYSGPGYFKFAVVDSAGTTTSWSNDGTSTAGSQPSAAITLTVANGLFDVLLGDTSLTNMTDLPASAFPIGPVRKLRVWFSTTNAAGSFTQLAPDRRVAAAPYALQAEQAASARAVIPFSSGMITPSAVTAFQPVVMGFGSNAIVFNGSPVSYGRFAFTAPSNGLLERLQASVDAHFAPSTSQAPLTYIFRIMTAPSAGGSYVWTPLNVFAIFPLVTAGTFPTGAYLTVSGSNSTLIPVLAGDRIVLEVTTDLFGTPPALNELALQASLLFTPVP